MNRNPHLVTAREGTRNRRPAACARLLVEVGQLQGVVAFGDRHLLEDGLVGRPDPAKGGRVLRVEHPLHLDDELVHPVERSPVLEGLDRVEEAQVQDVGVGGYFLSCLRSLMSHPAAVPAATMSGSSPMLWAGALSCWTITLPGGDGHMALMAGKT